MIEAIDLTKRYGDKVAVDHLSFSVEPGRVTGFLGPNGAGKSTTMRLLLGLDHPDSGDARIKGRHYTDIRQPMRVVGALLEARAVHTGRSAKNHLLCLAQSQGISTKRVQEVIDLVGLHNVAKKRAGAFSLGMGQRLGIAVALLGDPSVLILDEPVNGLDPDGIVWIRTLMQALAAQGRTVFVSSHLMNEMAVTADHLIVIGRGRLLANSSMKDFIEASTDEYVTVHSPDIAALSDAILREGGDISSEGDDRITVRKLTAPRIGELASAGGHTLYELAPHLGSLEDAFMKLTRDSLEFDARADLAGTAAGPPVLTSDQTSAQPEEAAR